MQINTQTVQRPKLFDSFLGDEIDYKNDFVVYINVTSNANNNIIHKKTLLQKTDTTLLHKCAYSLT